MAEDKSIYSLFGKNFCSRSRIFSGINSGVKSYNQSRLLISLRKIFCNTHRGLPYNYGIYAVCPCTHFPAKSRCTKGDIFAEAIPYLIVIPIYFIKLCLKILGQRHGIPFCIFNKTFFHNIYISSTTHFITFHIFFTQKIHKIRL